MAQAPAGRARRREDASGRRAGDGRQPGGRDAEGGAGEVPVGRQWVSGRQWEVSGRQWKANEMQSKANERQSKANTRQRKANARPWKGDGNTKAVSHPPAEGCPNSAGRTEAGSSQPGQPGRILHRRCATQGESDVSCRAGVSQREILWNWKMLRQHFACDVGSG